MRRAAERAVPPSELWHYEDHPYAEKSLVLRRALGGARKWRNETVEVTGADVEAKCAAVAAYESQVGQVYRDRAELDARVRRSLSRRGGERLWRRR